MTSGDHRPNLHERLLDRYGSRGEALYMLVLGFLAITANGLVAYLLRYPLLFPSLAPTVFLLFRSPLSADASPRNTIVGHFTAIALGYASLAVFGLLDAPGVLETGVSLARVGAAASSLAATEAVLISLRVPHTPAATTTMLVSLGLFQSPTGLISLGAGIALVTATSWLLNRAVGVPVPLWKPRHGSG